MNYLKNKIKLNKKTSLNKGVVLVFAIVIVSIVLTISLGLVSITVNELNFSTFSAESNKAFYAANTGAECILYYDFKDKYDNPVNCADNTINLDKLDENNDEGSFYLYNLNNNNSCAKVKIKRYEYNGAYYKTKILSEGYNMDCGLTSPRKLEREIELNYCTGDPSYCEQP